MGCQHGLGCQHVPSDGAGPEELDEGEARWDGRRVPCKFKDARPRVQCLVKRVPTKLVAIASLHSTEGRHVVRFSRARPTRALGTCGERASMPHMLRVHVGRGEAKKITRKLPAFFGILQLFPRVRGRAVGVGGVAAHGGHARPLRRDLDTAAHDGIGVACARART